MKRDCKVLCVDDDAVELIVLRAWLELAGYEVVTQRGPLGTSQLVLREKPDVIVLDMNMPALSGDILGRIIGQVIKSSTVGIVFYSAMDPEVVRMKTAGLRVLGVIRKTHDGGLFLAQLERILGGDAGVPRSAGRQARH